MHVNKVVTPADRHVHGKIVGVLRPLLTVLSLEQQSKYSELIKSGKVRGTARP
jgi:hypothetical protein